MPHFSSAALLLLLLLIMANSSRIFLIVGGLLLCHAAYSCLHYRELLRDLQDAGYEVSAAAPLPPWDVWCEIIAGFFILLGCELTRSGSALRPVSTRGALGSKKFAPLVAPAYRSRDFDIYTARAKAM